MLCKGSSGKSLLNARLRLESAWYPDCMICLTAKRHTRFDCGHLVACKACTEQLVSSAQTCPVCRQPISRTVFDGMIPLPGRQPTFESKEIGLQRLVTTLAGDDAAACEEAEMVVCQRALEETAHVFVDAGVIPPLVRLLTTQRPSLGRQAACCALGILAASGAHAEVLAAGGVSALLNLLGSESAKGTPSLEYAALALGALTEHGGPATAAAVHESTEHGGGLRPLIELASGATVDGGEAALVAVLVALADLAAVDTSMGREVAAMASAEQQLAKRLGELEGSGDAELASAAAALRATIQETQGGVQQVGAGSNKEHRPAAGGGAAARDGGREEEPLAAARPGRGAARRGRGKMRRCSVQ